MRVFNFNDTEIKAPTYWEADVRAESLDLETKVSNQTFAKLIDMIKRSLHHVEQQETIGNRDISVITKFNDEGEPEGIHFSVTKHDWDVCLLTKIQIDEGFMAAKDALQNDDIDLYDYHLENII